MKVRKATVRDAKTVAQVIRSSFAEYRTGNKGPQGAFLNARKVRSEIRAKKKNYALAHDKGKEIGVIGYKTKRQRLIFGPVGVLHPYRRRGVGRMLLRWIETHARKKKCRAVQAEVLRGLSGLTNFYRKQGYRTYRNRNGRTIASKRV